MKKSFVRGQVIAEVTQFLVPSQRGLPMELHGDFVLALTGTLAAGSIEIWSKAPWDADFVRIDGYTSVPWKIVSHEPCKGVLFELRASADFVGTVQGVLAQ